MEVFGCYFYGNLEFGRGDLIPQRAIFVPRNVGHFPTFGGVSIPPNPGKFPGFWLVLGAGL